jgi:hypothetical protein
MTRLACFVVAGAVILPGALPTRAEAPGAIQAPSVLDYEAFKTRVQPLFLDKRPGLARCYVCHSQGTPFRLQPLAQGATSWNEDASTKNFEAVRRYVVPGNPLTSRLLLMPLAAEAGGVSFHPGGRRWTSQSDPEWQMLADWVRGRPAGGAPR